VNLCVKKPNYTLNESGKSAWSMKNTKSTQKREKGSGYFLTFPLKCNLTPFLPFLAKSCPATSSAPWLSIGVTVGAEAYPLIKKTGHSITIIVILGDQIAQAETLSP